MKDEKENKDKPSMWSNLKNSFTSDVELKGKDSEKKVIGNVRGTKIVKDKNGKVTRQ